MTWMSNYKNWKIKKWVDKFLNQKSKTKIKNNKEMKILKIGKKNWEVYKMRKNDEFGGECVIEKWKKN